MKKVNAKKMHINNKWDRFEKIETDYEKQKQKISDNKTSNHFTTKKTLKNHNYTYINTHTQISHIHPPNKSAPT